MFDKEYVFRGKHARMVKKLVAKLSDDVGGSFFATNLDVYRLAPIVGYIYNRKAEVDKSDDSTKIFSEKIRDSKDELIFNYRVLMMLLNNEKSDTEKLDIAFRMDDKDSERKEYDTLYNLYVLGGIEEIYERIFNNVEGVDDYIMNLHDFLSDLNVRLYGMGAFE